MNERVNRHRLKTIAYEESGSMTLEAMVILPLFIAFFLAVTAMIHVVVVETALQSAVHETTKQVAAHIYPIYILHEYPEVQSWTAPVMDLVDKLPQFLRKSMLDGVSQAASPLFLPLLQAHANPTLLNPERLQIVSVQFPDFHNGSQALFEITAGYEYRLFLPFITKEWTIQKTAAARVWIGGD